ncbi:AEC family transporter [Nocardioides sp. ChNu-99]|uniref:AEC family transporter n=1 Tax=Nocardioides sp. ChNu-99 TaxID=2839897 RepID=UPI002406685D|nr:AEC family transporter [Nocardioides sp. ChNu-99]MDF9715150.1 AEC family transporter [Nocardioides sp. ChNu-99]
MTAVLEGFATIGVLILVGVLLAHLGVIDLPGQRALSLLAFYVASPALLITVLEDADIGAVLSSTLVASAAAVVVTATVYVLVARLVLHRDLAHTVVGSLCSAYVNAGNLGIPIAAYVLGDAALVAPVLLLQLLVLQPLALTVMDVAVAEQRLSVWRILSRPLRTPLTVGSVIGLVLAGTDVELPRAVHDPLELLAAMAVPSMLLAYGVYLRLGPRPGLNDAPELLLITALKLGVQPVVAWAVGRFVLGLDDTALLAVTVISALPTAQNVFVHATRYDRGVVLARDAVFLTTVLSVPVVTLAAALVV